MSDSITGQDLASSLTQTANAVGRLAADAALFTSAVDALRSEDVETFNQLLNRLQIGQFCEDICRWFCSKECVLECIQFCGLPTANITVEQIPQFAQVIAKITADEKLNLRLAEIVQRRDATGYKALVKELKIEPFCQLLCHWVCGIRCRLICEIVCGPKQVARKQLAGEMAIAGDAIRRLASNSRQLQTVISAAVASNCDVLKGVFGDSSDCFVICEWICSWRCILVCLPLCRAFPPSTDVSINEMLGFAQLCGRLASKPDSFSRLVAAVQSQNVQTFSALAKELEIGAFCLQICHWLCYEICRLFCFCVCPEPMTIPVFTHVGKYQVDFPAGDFNTNGTTTDHGFAFATTVDLRGILPPPDGNALHAIEYRFTFQDGSRKAVPNPVAGTPITGAMVPPTVIGILEYMEFEKPNWVFKWKEYFVNNPGAAVTIQQNGVPPLNVSLNVDTDANGWIQEPWLDDFVNGGQGRFVPLGVLARLDTTKLTNEFFDLTPIPVQAGDSIPAPQQSVKPVFQINFEARKVVGLATVGSNILNNIALSNTNYKYDRHPDWAGSTPVSIPVLSLDILELKTGGGCNPLAGHIHALFTTYHPYLATCVVFFEGPAPLPAAINPPILADGEANSPVGGHDFDISALKPCAYILWLEATLNLTDGYTQLFGTFSDQIAFCVD